MFPSNHELIEEEDELEGSRISLFTNELPRQGNRECIIENLDSNFQVGTSGTVQITESNNEDFDYSESNYQHIASSSIGAII